VRDLLDRPLRGEPLPLDLLDTLWAGPDGPVDLFDRRGGVAAWLAEHRLPGRAGQVEGPLREARAALRAVVEDPHDGAALDAVLDHGRVRRRWLRGAPLDVVEVSPAWRPAWTAAAAWLDLPGDRVRRCAASDCVLVFLDVSRNGGRRWCSMATCGSRSKAADYYRRKRGRD
jgi:predicted RNA-binding Zn ribbon-like protein